MTQKGGNGPKKTFNKDYMGSHGESRSSSIGSPFSKSGDPSGGAKGSEEPRNGRGK